jgi:hypothetical protein
MRHRGRMIREKLCKPGGERSLQYFSGLVIHRVDIPRYKWFAEIMPSLAYTHIFIYAYIHKCSEC